MPRPLTPAELDELRVRGLIDDPAPVGPAAYMPPVVEVDDDPVREGDALGMAKQKYAAARQQLTDAEKEQDLVERIRAERGEDRPESLVQAEIDRERGQYAVLGPSGPVTAEEAEDLRDAYTSPDTLAKKRARAAAGAFPLEDHGPSARDERWVSTAEGLSRESPLGIVTGISAAMDEPIPAGEAVDKPWVRDLTEGLSTAITMPLVALSPVDSAVQWLTDGEWNMPVVPTLGEIAEMPGKIKRGVTGAMDDEDADIDATGVATRVGLAVGGGELVSKQMEALGADPEVIATWDATVERATHIPSFDAAGRGFYDGSDVAAMESVPYRDLPASLQKGIDLDLVRRAVEPGGMLHDEPAAALLQRAVERAEDELLVEREASELPLGLLRVVVPTALPTNKDIVDEWRKRAEVQEKTGIGDTTKLLKLMAAATVDKEDGEIYFKPSKVQRALSWAGLLPEFAWESDVPLNIGGWNPASWAADALGYEQLANALGEARIPTKAGWESWVATGTLDPYLHEQGYRGSEAPLLRPGADTTYLGRIGANVAHADYQGPGMLDALRRQGEPEQSALSKWAMAGDTVVDVLMPVDDLVLAGMGAPVTAARRAWVAGNTGYRAGLRGTRVARAATAGVVPALVGEADRLAALDKVVREGVEAEVRAGNRLFSGDVLGDKPPPPHQDPGTIDWKVQRDWARKLEAAGVNPQEVADALNALSDEQRRLSFDAVARDLKNRGGPADVALRASPEYAAIKAKYDDLAAARNITPRQADMTMAGLELLAWRAVGDGKVAIPEAFFGAHAVEQGGTPAAGAYFQDAPATPEFRRWFGESKVVDEGGKPMVVYHGTDREFPVFNFTAGINVPVREAVYFSDSPSVSSEFAGGAYHGRQPQVLPVYLKMDRPLVFDAQGRQAYQLTDDIDAALRAEREERGGYGLPPDGVIIKNVREFQRDDLTTTYAVLKPEQIKSATANVGTFDPADPSILRDPAGGAATPPRSFDPPTPPDVLPERHPADTWGDTRGPLGWWMPLDEVEAALHGIEEEYVVLYDGAGRQVARWGPEDSRAEGVDPARACVVYPSALDEVARDGNATYTHVHPSGGPFSIDDLLVGRRANVAEIRAVADGDGFTWVVKRPEGGWPEPDAMRQAYNDAAMAAVPAANRKMDEVIRAAGGNPADGAYARGYNDRTWRRFYGQAIADKWNEAFAPAGLVAERVPNRGPERLGTGVRPAGEVAGAGPEAADLAARRAATPVGGQVTLLEPGDEYAPLAPTFYSALRRAVDGLKQERFSADQLRAFLRNAPGVKAEEIEWTRIDDFLRENPRPTKAETLAWLDENAVVVEERVLGQKPTSLVDTPEMADIRAKIERAQAEQGQLQAQIDEAMTTGRDPELPNLWRRAEQLRIDRESFAQEWDAAVERSPAAETLVPTSYASYTLPGGANYRELLFKLPERPWVEDVAVTDPVEREAIEHIRARTGRDPEEEWAYLNTSDYVPLAQADYGFNPPLDWAPSRTRIVQPTIYTAPHFGAEGSNLLAHVRFNDRVDAEGKRVLFVEEVQSDWHQEGRERGYRAGVDETVPAAEREFAAAEAALDAWWAENTRGAPPPDMMRRVDIAVDRLADARHAADTAVPPAPFKATWPDLVMKRVLRWAAENGYDRVAWTPGIEQVKRYEDATRAAVDEVRWMRGSALDRDKISLEFADIVRRPNDDGRTSSWQVLDRRGALLGVGHTPEEAVAGARGASDLWKNRTTQQLAEMRQGPVEVEVIGIKDGREVYRETMPPEKVADVLGKGMANQIASDAATSGTIKGPDLTVGGEGMREFYDRMLPSIVNKLVKKDGGRVGTTTIHHGEKRKPRAMVDDNGDGTFTVYRYDGDDVPVEIDDWDEVDTFGSRSEANARVKAIKDEQARGKAVIAHAVDVTPSLRDRVLHEGQPLFERRGGTVLGSIEPTAAANWLIRYFTSADIGTVLHENAHLMRFVMGDDWVDRLVTFLPHEPDPARPGKMRLTREGEERFADGFSRLMRGKIAPRGRLRAYYDEFKDRLADLWMRVRGLPVGVSPEMRRFFDASLNPGGPLRKVNVGVSGDALPARTVKTTVEADLPARLEQEGVKRTGQVLGDVGTADSPGASIDVVVGSRAAREVDAMEAAGRALADTAVETARRQWGFTGDVTKLTRRTHVPAARAEQVLRKVDNTMRAIHGAIKGGDVIALDPVSAAKMKMHVDMLADTGTGYEALKGSNLLDPRYDFTSMPRGDYNRVREATIDRDAGPGARVDRVAAQNVGNAAYGVLKFLSDSGPVGGAVAGGVAGTLVAGPGAGTLIGALGGAFLYSERVSNEMRAAFTVNFRVSEYTNPAVADAFGDVTRELGDITGKFKRAIDDVKRKNPMAMRHEILNAIARSMPVMSVQVPDIPEMLRLHAEWVAPLKSRAEKSPTLDGLLVTLDDVAGFIARNPAVASTARESEHQALLALAGYKADPRDFSSLAPDEQQVVADAVGILHDALRRRGEAVKAAGTNIGIAMSGSDEKKLWVGLHLDKNEWGQLEKAAEFYAKFYDGDWNGILESTAAVGQGTSPQSGFDPVAAAAAAITRMMALDVLNGFATKMLDAGIALDVDTATRLGRQFEAFRPIGATDAAGLDRAAFRDEVLRCIQAEMSFKMIGADVVDSAARRKVGTEAAPGTRGQFSPDAYRAALSILSSWGFKPGADTAWKALVLADGSEVMVPEGLWGELTGVMDRAAKAGLAWAARGEAQPVLGRWYNVEGIAQKAEGIKETVTGKVAARAAAREDTLDRRVARVVQGVMDFAGWSYSMSRVNMVTGVGIPNPANFIGNLFGGAVQLYNGKGATGALRVIGRYAAPTANGKVLRHAFLSLFDDYRGLRLPGLWRPQAVMIDGRGMVWTGESIADEARRAGLHSSQARSESTWKLVDALRKSEGKWWARVVKDFRENTIPGAAWRQFVARPFNAWQDILMETSTAIDNLYRVGAFIDELSIGKGVDEAAETARRVAFDYNAVTDFEREVLRPAVMFYTYTRRNMDLQWWTMLNHPSRLAGSLRGIRDAQEMVLGEESELIWPEYMDGRLILGMRETTRESNLHGVYAGVGRVAPPIGPSDSVVLVARLLGAVTGAEEERRETLSMLSPWSQFPFVAATGYDIWSGRSVDEYNTVPAWLVEMDQQALDGLLTTDLFDVEASPEYDPMNTPSDGARHFKARNARYWWAFRNLMPIGGGRTIDTVTAMARADFLSSAIPGGVVTAGVEAAQAHRASGDARLTDPLVDLARDGIDWLPAINPYPAGDRDYAPNMADDVEQQRVGMKESEERGGLFAIKPVRVPTRGYRKDELLRKRGRAMDEAARQQERSEPY